MDEGSNDAVARRLLPSCARLPAETIYADLELPLGADDRPYVVLNMASTADGKVAIAGRARGIGSQLDRDLMRRIRAAADAVMVGAGTIRAEPVDPRIPPALANARAARGQAPQPLAVAVSGTLNLDPGSRFFVLGPDSTLVFTTTTAEDDRAARLAGRARVERSGDSRVDLVGALARLRSAHGVARLLVEGGPTLNQALLERGLVDELFWTIAPRVAGGSGPGLVQGHAPPTTVLAALELVSLFEHHDELLARYRVRRG